MLAQTCLTVFLWDIKEAIDVEVKGNQNCLVTNILERMFDESLTSL